jgi:hypothetical protein
MELGRAYVVGVKSQCYHVFATTRGIAHSSQQPAAGCMDYSVYTPSDRMPKILRHNNLQLQLAVYNHGYKHQ